MMVIACGMECEARIARNKTDALVIASQGNPTTFRESLEKAVALGADRFLSFGTCGALTPDFHHGDIAIGYVVRDGAHDYHTNAAWTARLLSDLKSRSGYRVQVAHVACTSQTLLTP